MHGQEVKVSCAGCFSPNRFICRGSDGLGLPSSMELPHLVPRGLPRSCRRTLPLNSPGQTARHHSQSDNSEHTSRKLIHLHSNLKKWLFPKKWKLDGNLRVKSFFTENLNGPYGPYEHIVRDRSSKYWPKNRVFDENWKIRVLKNWKMSFETQNGAFEIVPSSKNHF